MELEWDFVSWDGELQKKKWEILMGRQLGGKLGISGAPACTQLLP